MQLVAGVRQQVLVPRRVIGVAAALDNARLLERTQPAREHVARRTCAGGDLVEVRAAVPTIASASVIEQTRDDVLLMLIASSPVGLESKL